MLAAFVILAIVTLLSRRASASRTLGRLRALFPAWRLFDRAIGSPALHVRFAAGGAALGPWSAIHARHRRGRAVRWLFAPHDNLALAYQAVVDQLVFELGELDDETGGGDNDDALIETDPDVVALVSYDLVTRIARAYVPAGARFQWKIVVPGEPTPETCVDYLVSAELAA